MLKYKLYLKSISYGGENIGDDLDISIRVLENSYTLALNLKHGQQKIFEPLEFIVTAGFDPKETELQTAINILLTELDPTKSDHTEKEESHSIEILSGSTSEFTQLIKVSEHGVLPGREKTAVFTFNFQVDFPIFENVDAGNMILPGIFPPLLYPLKPSYGHSKCDLVCLQQCASGDWNCILKCCA